MLAAIRQWVIKTMTKGQTGVVTTMPKPQLIEMNVQITAERIMRNGINPEDLKTVGQVENVINQIDTPKVNVNPGVTKVKKAPVFDMEGNKIPEGSKIMGGKEVKPFDELKNYTKSEEEIIQDLVDQKFGKGYFDDVDGSKAAIKEAAIKARLDADNKKGIASIKNNKMIDDAIEDASPGFADGDTKYDAELVAENLAERRGLTYDDLSPKERSKIYGEAYDALAEQRFRGRRKPKGDDPEEKADGGRIGLKGGAFLNFIKNMTMNKKSPLQFSKDYLKNVKEKTLRANETGKFMDLPLAEVGLPATTGALVNNQIRKKLKAMNEEQKEENLKNFIMKLENDEFYQKYPELKDETIANYTEKLFGEKKADGGRIGLKGGADAATKSFSSTGTGRKDPVGGFDLSGGKGPTFDNAPPTIGGGGGDNSNNPPTPKTKKTIPPALKKAINMGGDISYFKNLIELNPVGLGLNIGGKILFDKIFGDQSSLPTEEDDTGIMQMAELNDMGRIQLRNLEKKKAMEPLGGDPFTDKDQQMLDELERRDADPDNTYGPVFAADGGRIGLKGGSVDKMRRLILKAMGAGTVGIGAAKSGIFSFGKGAGKTVAKEVAQQTTSSMPPPYFFKLAEKIKMMGDDATATTERTIAKTLKSKDGKSTYLLEEDITSGDTIIKKINKEGDEMITDVEIMELKKGEVVMGKNGKPVKTPDEYEEVTEANARIEGDTFNDPYYSDGIQVDEIIKEVDDKVPSIKYASGGLAYMLGE